MANKLHTDVAAPPIIESIICRNMDASTGDLETATKTITATAEASGLGNADYSKAATFPTPTDARVTISNLISILIMTIDSDDGTHDLRCRVYIDAQDANHMLIDATCSTTGAQVAVQPLNASTLATLFALVKDGASHTYYFYLWSPGNHSPVVSVVSHYVFAGSNSTGTIGAKTITFTSTVPCELQVRQLTTCGPSPVTSTCYAFLAGYTYYDACFAITDTGALSIAGSPGASSPGSWAWQLLPADCVFDIHTKVSAAAGYHSLADIVFFVKRWS